jgi:hypothetical protein
MPSGIAEGEMSAWQDYGNIWHSCGRMEWVHGIDDGRSMAKWRAGTF